MIKLKKIFYLILLIWGILISIGGIGATFDQKEDKIGMLIATFIIGVLPLIIAVYFLTKKNRQLTPVEDKLEDDPIIETANQATGIKTIETEHQTDLENSIDNQHIEEASPLLKGEDRWKNVLSNILKYLTIVFKYTFVFLKITFTVILSILKAIAAIFKAIGEAGENSNSTAKQTSKNKSLFSELLSDQKITCDVRYKYIFKGNSGSASGKYRVHKSESAVIAEIRRLNPQRQNIVITSIKWKD